MVSVVLTNSKTLGWPSTTKKGSGSTNTVRRWNTVTTGSQEKHESITGSQENTMSRSMHVHKQNYQHLKTKPDDDVNSIDWLKVVFNQKSALNETSCCLEKAANQSSSGAVCQVQQQFVGSPVCSVENSAANNGARKGRHTTNKLAMLPNLPMSVLGSRCEIAFLWRTPKRSVPFSSVSI